MLFRIPLNAHRYLIEVISKTMHPKVMLSSRFIGFHEANQRSKTPIIRLLSSLTKDDQRFIYTRNFVNISESCGISNKLGVTKA